MSSRSRSPSIPPRVARLVEAVEGCKVPEAPGEGRDWLHNSTLATWVLMEACNESARTGTRVDVKAMHADLLGE